MKLLTTIFILLSANTFADTVISNDTTINGTFNLNGAVLKVSAKIGGDCIITNAKIDANLFIQIFDTSVIIGSGCMIDKFSAMWYGAKGSLQDNSVPLQKAINACINRNWALYIPGVGIYHYSSPLFVGIRNGGNYDQARIKMYGDATFWDSQGGTILHYTGDSFALGLQLNKGSEIDHLVIQGNWVSPTGTDSVYFNTSYANYTNQAASGNGRGIWIDPYIPASGRSGSTGISLHDLKVDKFKTLIEISNSYTQNAEIIIIQNIQLGSGRDGILSHQAQEKGNVIRGIYSWGAIHTLINIGNNGQAGNYYIDGGNIAGRCIRLFWISGGGFFPSYIRNMYCENIGTVGDLYGLLLSVENCVFDFIDTTKAGPMTVLTSGSQKVKFSSCTFRYYGTSQPLKMSGNVSFDNCYFSGNVMGLTNKVIVDYLPGQLQVTGSTIKTVVDTVSASNIKVSVKIN